MYMKTTLILNITLISTLSCNTESRNTEEISSDLPIQQPIEVIYTPEFTTVTSKKEQKEPPIDFLQYISKDIQWYYSGEVILYVDYKEKGNESGDAKILLLYKDGTDKYCELVRKRFPQAPNYPFALASPRLLKEDSTMLKDFDMYAFYLDKQYLEKVIESAEGGPITSYYPIYPCEYILYERKAGTEKWLEVGSKRFEDEASDTWWTPVSSDFAKQKIQEGNKKH